jgi:hypothetical protein
VFRWRWASIVSATRRSPSARCNSLRRRAARWESLLPVIRHQTFRALCSGSHGRKRDDPASEVDTRAPGDDLAAAPAQLPYSDLLSFRSGRDNGCRHGPGRARPRCGSPRPSLGRARSTVPASGCPCSRASRCLATCRSGADRPSDGSLEAILALVPLRREADADTLLRSLYKHVTTFAWLAGEPEERMRRWLKSDCEGRLHADDDCRKVGVKILDDDTPPCPKACPPCSTAPRPLTPTGSAGPPASMDHTSEYSLKSGRLTCAGRSGWDHRLRPRPVRRGRNDRVAEEVRDRSRPDRLAADGT